MANPSFSAPRNRTRLATAVLLAGLLGVSVGCVTISQSELEKRPRIGPPRTRVIMPSVPSGARIEVRCDFERLRTMLVYGGGGSLIRVRCPKEDLERDFAASGFAAGEGGAFLKWTGAAVVPRVRPRLTFSPEGIRFLGDASAIDGKPPLEPPHSRVVPATY